MKVGVAGASGRMGKGIVRAITESDDMELVLTIDLKDLGIDAGKVAGIGNIGVRITSPDDLEKKLGESRAQILVDFTNKEAALKNTGVAARKKVKMVIGTTGLKNVDVDLIKKIVSENHTSAVISPNMATGVNIFFKLVRDAALSLGRDFDVEIIEAHHHHKRDAPSGTALRVGELVANALGRDIEKDGVFGRRGMIGERKVGEIGVHALRAGDIVGDHSVLYAGEGERIEIIHRAHSRDAFINGVMKAIRFLKNKDSDGKVYSTWDVLGIK
jgi:4-hydroxy-tetrahydrodipicolinate reductase